MINHSLKTLSDVITNNIESMKLVHLDPQNLYFFILKSMNLFFIFLLTQIYSSDGYKKFIRCDLRNYLLMANNFKSEIMAYFYNNTKLEKMITIQQKKKKMHDGVDEIAKDVKKWKIAQENVLLGRTNQRNYET